MLDLQVINLRSSRFPSVCLSTGLLPQSCVCGGRFRNLSEAGSFAVGMGVYCCLNGNEAYIPERRLGVELVLEGWMCSYY